MKLKALAIIGVVLYCGVVAGFANYINSRLWLRVGDMSNILGAGGSKQTAFSVHGVTCAVMLVVGLFLIHVI